MSYDTIQAILLWIGAVAIAWIILIRIIRRFVHFPIPAFIARFLDNPMRRRLQPPAEVVGWVDIRDDMQILEIGPGSGTFTVEAARRVGENGKVFAVDISPAIISRLERKLQQDKITNVTVETASANQLPYSENYFDRIFMITVLGEIPDKRRALLEIKRVLKDDGLLAVGEFMPDPDYPRRKTVINWCMKAGFELLGQYGGFWHYMLTFRKSTTS